MQAEKPLKIAIFQAENGKRATAKALQGIVNGLELKDEDIALLKQNLRIFHDTTSRGAAFVNKIRIYVNQNKPDIVFIDPLISFLDGDVQTNAAFKSLLYEQLSPLMQETGVAFFIVHHTGKPVTSKADAPPTESDLAYSGIGGSLQTDWAREVLVLKRCTGKHDRPTCTVTATKRRLEAGFKKQPSGEPTTSIFVQHSPDGDYWVQIDDIQPQPKKDKAEKQAKATKSVPANNPLFVQAVKQQMSTDGKLSRKAAKQLGEEFGCSERTVFDRVSKWENN